MEKEKAILFFLVVVFLFPVRALSAPSRVIDLTVSSMANDSTVLRARWTTPAPQAGCTLTSYEVRVSPLPISAKNWTKATLVAGTPAPGSVGSEASMMITGLTAGTLYNVALKASDTCGTSVMSNLAVGSTSVPPTGERQYSVTWEIPTNANVPPYHGTIQGIKVYCGPGTRSYNQEIDVGYTTQAYVSVPDDGQVYYFALSAYGYDNNTMEPVDSGYGPEVDTTQATDPKD
jgi:hypothetical protein